MSNFVKSRRVVLVVPPYNMSRIMSALPEDIYVKGGNLQVYPFIGVQILASVLKNNGYDLYLLDSVAERKDISSLIKEIIRISPLFVGIYVNSFMVRSTRALIAGIKRKSNIPVLIGGPHITAVPISVITLNADFGVRGDGEDAIINLAIHLLDNERLERKTGIFTKYDAMKNDFPEIAIVKDLDNIPLPLRMENHKKRYFSPFYSPIFTTTIISRGCPYRCIFCMSGSLGSYRLRSVDSAIEEMRILANEGYRTIQFQDDVFNLNSKWLNEFCEKMIKTGLNKTLLWDCNVRVELLDEDIMNLMSRAGCRMIRFGAETNSEIIRNDILHKNIKDTDIYKAISLAKRYNIKTLGYFMLGLPGENQSDGEPELEYILDLSLDYIDVSIAVILPATLLERMAIKEGIIDADFWIRYPEGNDALPVFVSDRNFRKGLIEAQRLILKGFYLRKGYIIKEFLSSLRERRIINSFRSFIRLNSFYI